MEYRGLLLIRKDQNFNIRKNVSTVYSVINGESFGQKAQWFIVTISGYLKNYEDSLKCETVEIDLDEDTANDLDALCDQCGVSRHAFFSGVSKYLCDPENRERIIERLQSALKEFPGLTDNAMDTALMQADKEADRNPERV